MTRRRTITFVLGVCIGSFLLLFGDALADVTEASTTPSGKLDSSQAASTPRAATTILTRVSPSHQNQSIREKDGRNVGLTNRKAHDEQDGSRHNVGSDEGASLDEEKSDVSVSQNGTRATSQAGSPGEEIESPSSADGSRRPRYGEISAESSGKSTSTKAAASERPLRLSRTNELTIATAKPALNDSKQDNKKNLENATFEESAKHEGISDAARTVPPGMQEKPIGEKSTTSGRKNSELRHVADVAETAASGNRTPPSKSFVHSEEEKNSTTNTGGIMTVASIENPSTPKSTNENVVKFDEKKDKVNKPDHKAEVVPKLEPKDKSSTLARFTAGEDAEDQQLELHDREMTTMRGVRHEDLPKTEIDLADLPTTASEAFDLEKIDAKRQDGGSSLINDTYVNYKTQTEKDSKTNAGNQSTDVDGSRGKGADPKEEVEVVEDVTHQPILKIVDANNTAGNDSHANELRVSQTGVVYDKRGGKIAGRDKDHEEQKVLDAGIEGAEERKSIGKPESQVKSLETTTSSVQAEEQTSSTPKVIPSPIPQGRTIEFSGVNEFPSIEVKSTPATRIDGGTAPVMQSTKMITLKPYPYAKSAGSFEMTTAASLKPKNSNSSDVAEETSAYENTIGREESEKKFIVTEASVVLENSIQQQKPDEKSPSESANFTTENSSSATVIPMTSGEIRPTNETLADKSTSGAKSAEKDSRSKESGTSPTKTSEEKAITGRDEGYDVTGNGITEVSLPAGEEAESRFKGATAPSTARSSLSEMPTTSKSPNTDVQMDPEEAMMIRSTLVVTESTIVPLDKDSATEANQSTTSMTPSAVNNTIAAAVIENTTESTLKTNATLQPPSSANHSSEAASTTLNPDESPMPTTTTSIEFEFVGLTEAIPSNATNVTEKSMEGRTFEGQTMPTRITIPLTTLDSSVRHSSTEEVPSTTTRLEDSTELPATTEDENPTTDPVSTTMMNDTGEVRVLSTRPIVDEQSNRTESSTRNEVTTIDFTGTATDIEILVGVTDDPVATSKDSSFDANVTMTPAPGVTEFPLKPAVTILPAATNVTKSPSAPLAPTLRPSTSEPEVLWSTPNGTESSEEDVTKSIQTLSQDEITLLVKIVIEGTLQEICPRLQDLRSALASVLSNGMDKPVSWRQIVIHQNPCQNEMAPSSSPTPMEVPLTTILVYIVDEDNKFDAAMTKILPSLYKVSHNFPVRIHKFVLVQETDSGNAIAVVVVSSVAFICLVLLAGLLFIMRKRQTRFNYGERCRPVSLDAYSLDSVSAYSSVRRKVTARTSKRSYGNPTFEDSSAIPSHPLNFTGLLSFCNDLNPINEEFANIPQVSVKIDELPPDAEVKNRYANVIPLPETRVPLERLNNDAMTEYINASYVRGPKNATKYYIACQAPLDSTVTDFWRMIWEQQCKVIIMLTDLVENGVEKCTEYIPPSEVTDCHRLYGDFQVTLKKRETKEKYAISTLHLKNLENNTFREVFHIWYLWPVSGIETEGAGLIAVLLEARALQRGGPGPIVVHCSSGTGRTGTLIALDLGIRQYEITRTVDVPRVVYTIRRDRAGAVQTKEQYAFIYKALNLYATKLAGGVLEST